MPKLDEQARGVYVIAVTPFHEDGGLDLDSADRMVEFYLERGADGLTILGMMGEAHKLTTSESVEFVARVMRSVGGRVPVIVGASAPGFAATGELAVAAMEAGAAGVMVAPPSTLRTDDQIVAYYQQVATTLGPDIPFVLQDYPLVTGVQISVGVIQKLVARLPSLVALKHEDWPGLGKLSALRRNATDRRIAILVGNGGLYLPEELARGVDGAMTGFSYPEMMVDVVAAHAAGNLDRARDLFDAYLPLARYELQPGVGLAIRKHVLWQRGAIASPALRAPGPSLSVDDIAEIDVLVARQTRRLAELA